MTNETLASVSDANLHNVTGGFAGNIGQIASSIGGLFGAKGAQIGGQIGGLIQGFVGGAGGSARQQAPSGGASFAAAGALSISSAPMPDVGTDASVSVRVGG